VQALYAELPGASFRWSISSYENAVIVMTTTPSIWNLNVRSDFVFLGMPCTVAGSNLHFLMAATAFSANAGWE
jgi:hypothetical protein